MEFKAFKMDGLGNDFVIIDQRTGQFELSKFQIKKSPTPQSHLSADAG